MCSYQHGTGGAAQCGAGSYPSAAAATLLRFGRPFPARRRQVIGFLYQLLVADWLQERPRIIVVNCQPQSSGACPVPLVREFFPRGQPQSVVLTQGLNNEPLRFPLHLWYCSISLAKGAPVNRAIHRITSAAAPKPWSGPVLVLKFNGSRRQGYTDAGSNDLPALSSYFLAYK
jgi:hypothetical protein